MSLLLGQIYLIKLCLSNFSDDDLWSDIFVKRLEEVIKMLTPFRSFLRNGGGPLAIFSIETYFSWCIWSDN